MRGRAFVRLVIVIAAVAGMMLAPVVTWPSSGIAPGEFGHGQDPAQATTWP